MSDQAMILLSPETPLAMAGSAREEGGQPVRRFTKQLIRKGSYHKAADGISFEVTDKALDHWAATFSAMKENGVKVPIPSGHSVDPEDNRGWLVDMYREGDALVGVLDLVGEHGIEMAGTSDVSIYAPGQWTDGHGNTYTRPIRHVALCTDPVIPGLSGFVAVSASLGAAPEDVPVFTFKTKGTPSMDLKKIQTELGIQTDMTDDNAGDLILSGVVDLKKKQSTLEATSVSLVAKCDAMEKRLADSGKSPVAPDPLMLSLASDNCKMKLDGLVQAGKVTPAVRDGLHDLFVGDKGTALALSLSSGQGMSHIDRLVEILALNIPVTLGEQTGRQSGDLQLSQAGNSEEEKAEKEVTRQRMRKGAGLATAS